MDAQLKKNANLKSYPASASSISVRLKHWVNGLMSLQQCLYNLDLRITNSC